MGLPTDFLGHLNGPDGPGASQDTGESDGVAAPAGPAGEADAAAPEQEPGAAVASPAAQARAVSRRARAELGARPGSWRHGARHGQPSSVHQHRVYVESRRWVPVGGEGGFWDWEGRVFYRLIGDHVHRLGLGIAWAGDRQFRFWPVLAGFLFSLPVLLWLFWPVLVFIHSVFG
jgi:hypothetical protein